MENTTTQTVMEKQPETQVAQAERTRSGRCYRPNVDIVERNDELILWADIPGASAGDIDVNFENGHLTIHAKVADRQPEGTHYLLREYGTGDFYRTFHVSEAIDANGITAEYSAGVLTLHLPKVEAVKPRRINVEVK
jgi:HSP20 family protein